MLLFFGLFSTFSSQTKTIMQVETQSFSDRQKNPKCGTGVVILDMRYGGSTDSNFCSKLSSRNFLFQALILQQQHKPPFDGINLGAMRHPGKLRLPATMHGH